MTEILRKRDILKAMDVLKRPQPRLLLFDLPKWNGLSRSQQDGARGGKLLLTRCMYTFLVRPQKKR